MGNIIYALAEPKDEGGTLALSRELNIKTTSIVISSYTKIDLLTNLYDEPMYGNYEQRKTKTAILWGVAAAVVVGAIAVAACVVTGGLAAGLVVAGSAALVGGVGAGLNLAMQATSNNQIDWCQVAIAGCVGAISGAVAVTPLGIAGQMAVNAGLAGVQSATTGGSVVDYVVNIAIGTISGYLGGDGPKWKNNTNIFVPRRVANTSGYARLNTLSQASMSFKNVWRGLNSDLYVKDQFSGVLRGFVKGTSSSNTFNSLFGLAKKMWDLYEPD